MRKLLQTISKLLKCFEMNPLVNELSELYRKKSENLLKLSKTSWNQSNKVFSDGSEMSLVSEQLTPIEEDFSIEDVKSKFQILKLDKNKFERDFKAEMGKKLEFCDDRKLLSAKTLLMPKKINKVPQKNEICNTELLC